jgi:hypothetical protein
MATLRNWTEAVLKKPAYAALFAALTMVLPFVQWIGWGWVALTTLRYGAQYGLYVVLGASAGILVAVGMLGGDWLMGAVQIGLFIVPIWIGSLILHHTVSLSFTLQVMALGLLVVTLAAHFLQVVDVESLATYLQSLLSQGAVLDATQQDEIKVFSEQFAISWPAALFWIYVTGLFVGRWAQAALDNPGGFKQEFQELRLNYWVGSVAFVFVVISFWMPMSVMLLATSGLVTSLLAVAGLGLVHYYVALKKWSSWVLLIVYLGMFLLTIILLPLLAVLAAADSVLDIRKRLTKSEA